MRPQTQIRLVRPDEHVALREVRLSALAYAPHLAEHLARESAAPIGFWRRQSAHRAKATRSATFVAIDEGTFVGVIDGFLSEDGITVEIGGMWVSPEERRSGIGNHLLDAVFGWARERGVGRAALWVRAANKPARSLYEGAGFVVARTSTESGREGLRLERTL